MSYGKWNYSRASFHLLNNVDALRFQTANLIQTGIVSLENILRQAAPIFSPEALLLLNLQN